MLDIGWSEMAVIALVALVIIGPKDLPRVLRTVGQWTRKARSLAREFQSGLDDMIHEAELDEARKTIERTRKFDVKKELGKTVDPDGEVSREARAIDAAGRITGTKDSASARTSGGSAKPADSERSEAGEAPAEVEATPTSASSTSASPTSASSPAQPTTASSGAGGVASPRGEAGSNQPNPGQSGSASSEPAASGGKANGATQPRDSKPAKAESRPSEAETSSSKPRKDAEASRAGDPAGAPAGGKDS